MTTNKYDDDLSIEEILNIPTKPTNNIIKPHISKRLCTKCNGTGLIKKYTHVKHGKCFNCNGKGYIYIYINN